MIDYGFNTENVELDTLGLPAGTHKVMISKEEIKETPDKPTNPRRLVVTFQAVEGELKGESHVANYNLWNVNDQTVNIARQELKRIADATGSEVGPQAPLQGRVLKIVIAPQKKNPEYMEIKKYLPENDTQLDDSIPFEA